MASDLDRLTRLDVDPARLESAPDGPLRHSGYQARINPGPAQRPCSACGEPAVAACRLRVPGLGPRWLDTCRDCMIASMKREP